MSDPATTPLETLSAALSGLVARAAPSLVAIRSHRARSSGFVWKPGLVITADEALADEGEVAVTVPDGERVAATLVGRDPATDVALLRIGRTDLPPAALSQDPVAAGALALAVGSQDGAPIAALGAVSVSGEAWRSMRGGEISARIELDIALRRHAEGGLAIDAAGHAFGMTVFGPRRRVLIIPAATIGRVAAQLESRGRVARGYLGLGLQPVRLDGGGAGAPGIIVMSVDPQGPGVAAGIRQGDVIVAWEGRPVQGVQTLLRALGPDSVGTTVTLSLQRAGAPLEVRLTVGEKPQG